jgi:hypothetical protein
MRSILVATITAAVVTWPAMAGQDEQVTLDNYAARGLTCSHEHPQRTRRGLSAVLKCLDAGMREKFDALNSPNADLYDMAFDRHADVLKRLEKGSVTWVQAIEELQLLQQQVSGEMKRRANANTHTQSETQQQAQKQGEETRRQQAAQCAYGAYLMGAGSGSATAGAMAGNAELAYCRALGLPVPTPVSPPATPQTALSQPTTTTCIPWGTGVKCDSQ